MKRYIITKDYKGYDIEQYNKVVSNYSIVYRFGKYYKYDNEKNIYIPLYIIYDTNNASLFKSKLESYINNKDSNKN